MPKRQVLNPNPNKVFYIHLRYKNDDGSVANQGGLTIAWRQHENSESSNEKTVNVLEVAIARCNILDNFCRRVGRAIATGNLNYDRYWLHQVDNSDINAINTDVCNFVGKKVREIMNNHKNSESSNEVRH